MFQAASNSRLLRRALLILALIVSATAAALASGVTPAHATSIAPTLDKFFDQPLVASNGGVTTLTFDLTNPDPGNALLGLAFTDTLPSGMTINTPNGLLENSACSTGPFPATITAIAGTNVISLSNFYLGSGQTCTFSVQILVNTIAGTVLTNTTSSVTNTGSAPTGDPATAQITAILPPTFIKFFGAPTIPLGGTTSLTFEMTNPNLQPLDSDFYALNDVAFTDVLPAGLVVATPADALLTCSKGSNGLVVAQAGTNAIFFSDGTLSPQSSCFLTVNVTGIAAGQKNNVTTPLIAGFAPEPGSDTSWGTANASTTVVAPPGITKSFLPTVIGINGNSLLSFVITNPNGQTDLNNVTFTDTLPTGVVPVALGANSCAGTESFTESFAGPNTVSITPFTLAHGATCVARFEVEGANFGTFTNSVTATSSNGGTSSPSSAGLLVAHAPTIAKAFGTDSIPVGGTTSLTFTITNPNPDVTVTSIHFADVLPTGLVVAGIPNLTNTCGGVATATAGSSTISLTGSSLFALTSCNVVANVTGTSTGIKNNAVTVSSDEGSSTAAATATLVVALPPAIAKSFGAAAIAPGTSTSLTFTIHNPNTTVALTGIAFTDTLPAGLVVSSPSMITGTCDGGAITATPGTGTISLSGATLAASTSCTFTVNVTATTNTGLKPNSVQVTSTNGGTGNTATATITVAYPLHIINGFALPSVPVQSPVKLTFTIHNPNSFAITGAGFKDIMPLGLQVANLPKLTSTCASFLPLIVGAPGTNLITLTGATLAANQTCSFSLYVIGTSFGWKHNVTSPITAANAPDGNVGLATILV